MATVKPAYILLGEFERLFKEKYKTRPNLNKYKHQHGFTAMVDQYGLDESRAITEHFFKMERPPHKIEDLLYNYEVVKEVLDRIREDEVNRAKLREETRLRVESMRKWSNNE